MVGITAPKPEDERKILLVWIAVIVILIAGGIMFAYFIALHAFH